MNYTKENIWLTRRRKMNKKIMIPEHQGRNKYCFPNKKSIEEKWLKLLQRSLAVLKISIIHFPLKAPQKEKRHHLPHNNTLSFTSNLLTSKQVNYSVRHNPRQPKATKKNFHKAQAIAQWRRIWSTDSPILLHIQHLSITMTCRFLRLSMVRIFPMAADQA
jgi:hypothetical protein